MKRSPLRRKTPMKRTAMRRYRKPSAVAKADALAAAIVHARGICAVAEARIKRGHEPTSCRGPLEQHHARGRGKGFRWRTESHLLLCAWHHRLSPLMSAHGGPMMFARWLRRHYPEILSMPNVPETAGRAVDRMQNNRAQILPSLRGNNSAATGSLSDLGNGK